MADTGARRGMPPGLGVAGMVGRPADRQDRPEAGARRLPASPASAPALNDLHRPGPPHASLDGLQVLIVDDHALFADGLAMLLGQLAPGVRVSLAASCEAAIAGPLAGAPPDLTLFDLTLPGTQRLQAYRLLAERAPGVPIVAVSADERPQVIAEVMQAGARGYIPKSTRSEVMLHALQIVLCGGRYVPDVVVGDGVGRSNGAGLTPRERQVLALLAGGSSNKAIADQLTIAESTVRVHVTSVLRRFGVRSRAALLTLPAVRELLAGPPG
jgi:DNA-binding NarL/FixJ family response regulator